MRLALGGNCGSCKIEERIPYSHPLRGICKLAEQALETGGIKLSNKIQPAGDRKVFGWIKAFGGLLLFKQRGSST